MYWYQRLVRCRCSESIHPSVVLDRIIDNSAISTVSTEVEIFVRKQTAILLFGSVLARGRYQNPILSKLPLYTNRFLLWLVGSWNSWLWWDYYVRLWWAPCIAYFLYDDVDVLSVGCNKTFHVPVWRHPFGTVRKIIKHPTVLSNWDSLTPSCTYYVREVDVMESSHIYSIFTVFPVIHSMPHKKSLP